jgi:phosphate transport system permease protein
MSIGSLPPAADTRSGAPDLGPVDEGPSDAALPRTGGRGGERRGDRVFRGLSLASGSLVLAVIVAIAVFLVYRAVPALRDNTGSFLTEKTFFPNSDPPVFGIAALVFGTIVSSVLALVLAFPVALGVALFISHYAPRRLAGVLGYVVDLLAAVPSVVYGLWGIYFLGPRIVDTSRFLEQHAGWFPLFRTSTQSYGRSMLLAGVVLAIMVLPIIASLSREVFLQVPRDLQEAALALGATRWEMVRTAVLPFGRPGVIGATMLGLGRALGETIAVALVLSSSFGISLHILQPGGNTIAANIANGFGEAGDVGRGALIASGLVLFAITLVVNVAARAVIYRRREFSGGVL